MKNRLFTITLHLLAALCLLLCAQAPARAAEPTPSPTPKPQADYSAIAFVGGWGTSYACSQAETVRFNLAFNTGLAPAGSTISVAVRLKDLNGRTVYASNNRTITIDGMHTESVKRSQLAVPQTGPLTLLGEWAIAGVPASVAEVLPRSVEVLDTCNGRVLFHTGNGVTVQYRPVPGSDELAIDLNFPPVSLTYGQTLRLNLGHQWPLGVPPPTAASGDFYLDIRGVDGESSDAMPGRASFLPGQTLALAFNRDLLAAAGDAGTGRLTAQVVVRYRARLAPTVLGQMWNANTLPQFPGSLQLTDNNNTSAVLIGLLLPAVQKVREAAAR